MTDVLCQEECDILLAKSGLSGRIQELSSVKRRNFTPKQLSQLPIRPPVVTIMGHVDHGKTTLLDKIRTTNVAAGEAGGITQHIGAFHVSLPGNGEKITFFDTPGHESFTEMRKRGVQATDIVILVIALDDGVMPQTVESIQLARGHSVPIVVAFNKSDKFMCNLDRIKQQLFRYSIQLEEYGGDVQAVCISALNGTNISGLLEAVLAQAELMELRADPNGPVEGFVVETRTVFGIGISSTIILQHGTLHLGDILVCGETYCRVKSIRLCTGESVKYIGPGIPIEIAGWKELPTVGTDCIQCQDEDEAQLIIESYELQQAATQLSLQYNNLTKQKQPIQAKELPVKKDDNIPTYPIMLFCDVIGSIEAITKSVRTIPQHKITLDIIQSDIGPPSPNDFELASATGSTVICFNIKLDSKITRLAKMKNIPLVSFNIIYQLIDDLKERMTDSLPPSYKHQVVAVAQVKQIFVVDWKDKRRAFVAGCLIKEGIFGQVAQHDNSRYVRVTRNGSTILAEGFVISLRHLKEEVSQVGKGSECGIIVGPIEFKDFIPGDTIELVKKVKEKQLLI